MSPMMRLSAAEHGPAGEPVARGAIATLPDVPTPRLAGGRFTSRPPVWAAGAPEICDSGDLLISRMLETVMSLIPASVALGLKVGAQLTVERLIVLGARGGEVGASASLIRRLPDLEPIDPFNPRRAEAAGASVLWAGDVGGSEEVAASMYGRHLRRHGYGPPVTMYFRSDDRIVYGLVLLRTIEWSPFDAREVALLGDLRPFLETALRFTGGQGPADSDVVCTAGLTAREAQVAGLVADGLSNAGIAVGLGTSEATVKAHLTRVYAKLGVRSRTELAVVFPRSSVVASGAVGAGVA